MIWKNSRNASAEQRLFRHQSLRPMALLGQCPVYAPTPLRAAEGLANVLGIGRLMIKDETERMGLGSFKALGGAFAVAQMIADAAGSSDLSGDAARQTARAMIFTTASAGNHGLSVAAGARLFGAGAVIFLCSAVPEEFADRIRALGAGVERVDGSYEDSVNAAKAASATRGWLLLADGSWDGYTERPALVMEGYSVLGEECRAAFAKEGRWPTHVFLQAGVGGLAAAVAAHIRETWDQQPTIVVVEPEAAPCLLASVQAGRTVRVEGPVSNMGRLDCKEPSLIAFHALRQDADIFLTITDQAAEKAVDELMVENIATTPSGAASLAAIRILDPGAECHAMVIVTEGLEKG